MADATISPEQKAAEESKAAVAKSDVEKALAISKAASEARATAEKSAAKAHMDAAEAETKQIAADIALAKAAQANRGPLVISGHPGGPFNIEGSGFGDGTPSKPGGLVIIGGRVVPTTSWTDTTIKGQLPVGVQGSVLVQPTGKPEQKGVYPMPRLSDR